MNRVIALAIATLLTLGIALPAFADSSGGAHSGLSPKCTPASTPGCSGKR